MGVWFEGVERGGAEVVVVEGVQKDREATFRIKRNPVLLENWSTLGAFTGTLKRASETLRRKEN